MIDDGGAILLVEVILNDRPEYVIFDILESPPIN